MTGQTGQRRRGAELEASLLDAAWAELHEAGYQRLTMEGVAARAHTGKQVIYRRWGSKAELVIAAIRHATGSVTEVNFDTGSLRGDVLAFLRRMAGRIPVVGMDVIHGVLADVPDLDPGFLAISDDLLAQAIARAVARGEIGPTPLPARVVSLPAALLRYEILLSRDALPDATLTGILDDVFLPLVRAVSQSTSTGSASTP